MNDVGNPSIAPMCERIERAIYDHPAVAQSWASGTCDEDGRIVITATWTYLADTTNAERDEAGIDLCESTRIWAAPEGFTIRDSGPEDARGNGRGIGQYVVYVAT